MGESGKTALSAALLTVAALIWGSSFVVVKDTLNSVQPFTLCALRFMPSAVLLALAYAGKLRRVKPAEIKNGCIIGVFLFLCYLADILAFRYTTASKMAFITGLNVVFVPFLAWKFNGRRPDGWAIAGVALAALGLGLLTIQKGETVNIGDVIALAAAVLMAAHMIAIEHFGKNSDPVALTVMQFGVTGAGFVVLALAFDSIGDSSGLGTLAGSLPQISYLVVFCTLLTLLIQNVAQKRLSSTSTAVILMLTTVFGSISSIYFLHEYMSAQMAAGGILIIIAIVTQEAKWSFLKRRSD